MHELILIMAIFGLIFFPLIHKIYIESKKRAPYQRFFQEHGERYETDYLNSKFYMEQYPSLSLIQFLFHSKTFPIVFISYEKEIEHVCRLYSPKNECDHLGLLSLTKQAMAELLSPQCPKSNKIGYYNYLRELEFDLMGLFNKHNKNPFKKIPDIKLDWTNNFQISINLARYRDLKLDSAYYETVFKDILEAMQGMHKKYTHVFDKCKNKLDYDTQDQFSDALKRHGEILEMYTSDMASKALLDLHLKNSPKEPSSEISK